MAFNLMFYNMAFLEVLPQFKCLLEGTSEMFVCTEPDFCGNPSVEMFVDREHPRSIYNWSEKMGLICRPGWQIGLFGSSYFAGYVSTLLWMPQYADRNGRKKYFQYAMIINSFLYIVIMLSTNYTVTLISLLTVGFFTSWRQGVGFPYMIEFVGQKYRAIYGTAFSIFGSTFGIFGALFFLFFSKNAYYFMGVGCAL